jgi:hypothetical protein
LFLEQSNKKKPSKKRSRKWQRGEMRIEGTWKVIRERKE